MILAPDVNIQTCLLTYLLTELLHDRYEVGFDPSLAEIISEVKYLDELGFDVPPDAKTIALLEDQYVLRVSALKQMLKRFYDVLDMLDVSQVNSPFLPRDAMHKRGLSVMRCLSVCHVRELCQND